MPRYLLLINQLYNLRELFIKRAADNNRKGVVGNSGMKIPIIPSNSEIKPKKASRYLRIGLDGCLIDRFTDYLFSLKPILLCVPSQNGCVDELPHLHNATLFAFANSTPLISFNIKLPDTIIGPSFII